LQLQQHFAAYGLMSLLLRMSNEMMYISIMSLHNRIAVLRAEKKLSRATLASSLGVNPQTIGFLERGDYTPSLELAFKIAEHFERAGVQAAQEGGLRCR
jgi:DNA-binding XRE family transcriptional regulator